MNGDKPWELNLEHLKCKQGYLLVKRLFDLGTGLFLFFALIPIMIIVGFLIILFDGGPVFFKQPRTGLNGTSFIILKFRTMKAHDVKSVHSYSWDDGVPNSFVFKTVENPNVTKLGALLRKYSLDELPQLVNVIKGEMSIVGPRPEIPEITRLYNCEQKKRLLIKPGITGYAQVNGRSDITHGEKISYDLYYLYHCSFLLDLKIICLTLLHVLTSRGSY